MINELKTFLLNTGYFKDNEYLISYLSLINGYSTNIAGYSERHHVIPVAVYKYCYNCSAAEARKKADIDEKNYMISLLYKDHVLAHYLLYFCTKGNVKKAMSKAVICMLGNLEVDKLDLTAFRCLPEQFDNIQQLIDHIHADPNNNFYTPYEIDFLKTYYGENGPQWCAEQLNKPITSIKAKAHGLRLHLNTFNPWSEEELQILRQYYQQHGPDYCCSLLSNRDKSSICSTARRLGLQCGRLWSDDEVEFLIENYSKLGGKKCAESLNRPYASVRMKANTLNLTTGNPWREDELKLLKENYHKGAAFCKTLINRSEQVIRVKASELGLKTKYRRK